MKTKTARCSQVLWIAVTIGFALGILLAMPQTAAAQGPWLVSPSPTPTNNIYYNAGNVGIGTNAPDQKLVVSANSATTLPASAGIIQVFGANGVQPLAAVDGFAAAPVYLLRRANNTAASPSAVQANDLMGAFGAAGYGSTAYQGTRARVGFFASENWTNSANGTYMAFNTTANGAASAGGTERMRIDASGNVGIGTTTPGTYQGGSTFYGTVLQVLNSANHAQLTLSAAGAGKLPVLNFENSDATAGKRLMQSYYDGVNNSFKIRFNNESTGAVGTDLFTLQNTGNVGIGITTPGYKLDVQGGLLNASGGLCIAGVCKTTWAQVGGFSAITAGTNTQALVIGAGGSLGVSGSGTINATTLGGATFAAPGAIGGTTPGSGDFTTVSGSGANLTALSASNLASGLVGTARLGSGTADASTFLRGDNTWAVPSGGSQWTTGTNSISYGTGGANNVGIGTTTPGERLQIHGNLKLSSDAIPSGVRALTPTGWGYGPNAYRVLMVGAPSGNETVSIGYDPSGITNGLFSGDGREVLFRDGAAFTTPNAGANTFYYNTLVLKGGSVGIGTATPGTNYKLDVRGGLLNSHDGLCIGEVCKTDWSQVGGSQWTTGTNSISYSAGNVGIGTAATQYKLDVNGNTNVTGNINITGNINAKFQDMAEWVPSSEQLRAGTVVVLDTTKSNQVISSTQAYDTRVAGVVSERPGIALGESGEGKVLVATTGRVLVKVDATNGPIHIGDLLVTSDIPGLAMKSEPITIGNRKFHTPGTLIGKALEPLEKGSGKILVLLSLQ